MAGTYGRIDGRPGILLTIPGPGFAFALPGIAEAWQDSAPLLHIVAAAPGGPHARHRHQALDQNAIARAMTKAMFAVSDPARLAETVCAAFETARDGEPGPVIVQLGACGETSPVPAPVSTGHGKRSGGVGAHPPGAASRSSWSARAAPRAADAIRAYVERTGTPVFSSASGRGIVVGGLCLVAWGTTACVARPRAERPAQRGGPGDRRRHAPGLQRHRAALS